MLFIRIVASRGSIGLVIDGKLLEPRGVERVFGRHFDDVGDGSVLVVLEGKRVVRNDLVLAVGIDTLVAEAAGNDNSIQSLGRRWPARIELLGLIRPMNCVASFVPDDDEFFTLAGGGMEIHRDDWAGDLIAIV